MFFIPRFYLKIHPNASDRAHGMLTAIDRPPSWIKRGQGGKGGKGRNRGSGRGEEIRGRGKKREGSGRMNHYC